jgi:hypothetical protein
MRTRSEQFRESWQRIVASLFALAVMATPVLAWAQGGGTGGGGGGGTGSGAGTPPPGGTTGGGAPAGDEGGRGLAWIAVILAIAIVVYLFTRRRRGTVER